MSEMSYPLKKEKLSEKCVFLIPPSIHEMKQQAEKMGLNFPDFARIVLRKELERFLSHSVNE
jgi:hypothetical protein